MTEVIESLFSEFYEAGRNWEAGTQEMSIHMHAHTHTEIQIIHPKEKESRTSIHMESWTVAGTVHSESRRLPQLHSAANCVVTLGLFLSCPALILNPQDESMNLLGPPPASVS